MSQNGCAQTATPPAAWITSIASSTVGRERATYADRARHEVRREQRVLAVDPLGAQLRRVARVREHRVGEVRPPERQARRLARAQLAAVEPEAELLQPVRHRPDPAPAVGAEVGQRRAQLRVVVAQLVAAHVQVLELARRRSTARPPGEQRRPCSRAARERLADAVDRVVVGQRHESDSCRRGVRRRRRRAASAPSECDGVRLQVEVGRDVCGLHGPGTLEARPATKGRHHVHRTDRRHRRRGAHHHRPAGAAAAHARRPLRHKKAERELHSRRETVADEHRQVAAASARPRAEMAEQQGAHGPAGGRARARRGEPAAASARRCTSAAWPTTS